MMYTLLRTFCSVVLMTMTAQAASKQPNIIFIMTDDQGYGDVGAHGHPFLKTPHMDALYAQSTRFTNYYVSASCAPTRAALMSGKNAFEVGVTHTILERDRMALGVKTVAEMLQEAGYKTGIFGKWHLGEEDAYQPGNRGFDEVFIHGAGGIGQNYEGSQGDVPGNEYFDPTIRHNGSFVKTKGFCTDVFFKEALGWIKEMKEGEAPFFTYIATNAPHSPFIAPDKYKEPYLKVAKGDDPTAAFFGMITNIDDNLGLLMAKLNEWGLADNTLLIYTTDNGTAKKKYRYHNAGMIGIKGSLNEGGSRVPMFIRLPGVTEPGTDRNQLARHIDVFPTLAEFAGADISSLGLEGRSLVPVIKDTATDWPDRELFFHKGRWPKAGAQGSFGKGNPNPDKWKYKNFAVRSNRWRMVGLGRLYDIINDRSQSKNVIKEHPEVAQSLLEAYNNFWDKARPLMVNEDAPLDVGKPFVLAYEKQKETSGIPEWVEPSL